MRVGVIMPHRNDRPKFLEQFHRILSRQTLQPEIVEIVDYEPKSDSVDITERYKYGYDKLRGKGLDVIAFLEIDDWYSNDYLETMVNGWNSHGRPKMFGLDYTIYYHLCVEKSFVFKHDKRSSMMSTLMIPDLNIEWCKDDYPYTDSYLWKTIGGKLFNPRKDIALGLKHGLSLCGGKFHSENLDRYKEKWIDLKKFVGEEDWNFYRTIYDGTGAKLIRDRQKGLHLYFDV